MGYFSLTFVLLFPYFRKTGKDRKRSKKERAREKPGAPGTARDRGCSVSAQVAPSAPGVWAARCVCRDMSECLWISRRSMAAGLGQLPLGGQSGFSFVLFLLFLLFSYFSLLFTKIKVVHIQGDTQNTNRYTPPIRFKSYFSLLFLTFERQKKERKKNNRKRKKNSRKKKRTGKEQKKKEQGPCMGVFVERFCLCFSAATGR